MVCDDLRGVEWGCVGGELLKGRGYIYILVVEVCIAVWQKLTQHYKAFIPQSKINKI